MDIHNIGGELRNGLIWGKGIGQYKFQWFGRKHPKVLNIFSHLWSHEKLISGHQGLDTLMENKENADKDEDENKNENENDEISNKLDGTKDLITSFDGIGLFTPWYMTSELQKQTVDGIILIRM